MSIELHTPKISKILKQKYILVAVLDQGTRWGSSNQMLECIIRLRDAIKDMSDCGNRTLMLTDAQWDQIVNLRDLLKKAYDITVRLQYSDITPGYFFSKWSTLRFYYEEHGSLLASEIASSMKDRETKLFNEPLLAAVLTDVHNQDLLSEEQKTVAEEALINITLRMKGIHSGPVDDEHSVQIDSEVSVEEDSESDEDLAEIRKRMRRSGQASAAAGITFLTSKN